MKRILCVYATRQIDSNLFMSSTVFRGLQEAGYEVYMAFAGTKTVNKEFERLYSRYFEDVCYYEIPESILRKVSSKHSVTRLGYSFFRHFVLDGILNLPVDCSVNRYKGMKFDCILSFIPPVLSGRLATNLRKALHLESARLIQFWTDPLSLGRCDTVDQLPKTRVVHKLQERRLLKKADKVVFCYPLLCESEQKLHPMYADKMYWSDVSYIPHVNSISTVNDRPVIGLFGAYQKHVRNIEPLLDSIKDLPDYQFIIRGDGDLPYDVSDIQNLDIEYGRMPVSQIESLEAQCDILLSLGGRSGLTHPAGKTFYYASYNKPIIHIGDGANARYFENYLKGFEGRFIHCMNEKTSIVAAIESATSLLPKFQLHIPKRMNAAVIARKIIEV